MLNLTATTAGLSQLEKLLKAERGRHKKALDTALKVRGYKLAAQMKREIRAGAPGGRRFAPLTWLARRWGAGSRLRPDKPLSRLAIAVRYHVAKTEPLAVSVGFTHPSLSKSWRAIALRHQEGFTHGITDKRRQYFAEKAANLSQRAQGRRQLFIKKSTRTFRTPPRPIIDPFWAAHKNEALAKIRRDFRVKIKGGRI
jgi:hypothetical protein